jgi:hypothetical protein
MIHINIRLILNWLDSILNLHYLEILNKEVLNVRAVAINKKNMYQIGGIEILIKILYRLVELL